MAEEKILLLSGSLTHPELGSDLTAIYGRRLSEAGYQVQVGATHEQLEEALEEADLVLVVFSFNRATETLRKLIPQEARRKTIIWCVAWDLERVRRGLSESSFAFIGAGCQNLDNLLSLVHADLELVRNISG